MKPITIHTDGTVELNDVTRWDLFWTKRDADLVAKILNNTFCEAVNGGKTKDEVEKIMLDMMKKYSEYGANDSEPRNWLKQILRTAFNK